MGGLEVELQVEETLSRVGPWLPKVQLLIGFLGFTALGFRVLGFLGFRVLGF